MYKINCEEKFFLTYHLDNCYKERFAQIIKKSNKNLFYLIIYILRFIFNYNLMAKVYWN